MAHIWFMHDAHLGRAFLFLELPAAYTLLSMTVMVTPCLWYVIGMKLVCPMSKFPQAPFARAPFGECRKDDTQKGPKPAKKRFEVGSKAVQNGSESVRGWVQNRSGGGFDIGSKSVRNRLSVRNRFQIGSKSVGIQIGPKSVRDQFEIGSEPNPLAHHQEVCQCHSLNSCEPPLKSNQSGGALLAVAGSWSAVLCAHFRPVPKLAASDQFLFGTFMAVPAAFTSGTICRQGDNLVGWVFRAVFLQREVDR